MFDVGIYQIRNVQNNQCYIGSASQSFKGRWSTHLHQLNHGTHHSSKLQNATNKTW